KPCRARRPPLGAGELGATSGGDAGATGWGYARGGKGRSRAAVPPPAAPGALAARPPSWPCPAVRAGGLRAPARAGPPRVGAPPGRPWPGLRQAGSVGGAGRPQGWALAGAGWQGGGDGGGWDGVQRGFIPTATLLEHALLAQGFMGVSKVIFPRRLQLQNRDSTGANLSNTLKCRCRDNSGVCASSEPRGLASHAGDVV